MTVHARALLAVATLALLPAPARADWFRTLVRYECDTAANALTVTYAGAYNEEGDTMIAQAGDDAWDPWSLLEIRDDEQGTRVERIKRVSRTCDLGTASYRVTLSGKPGNMDLIKRCGLAASAHVLVEQGGATVFDSSLEGDCHDGQPIITRIEIVPGVAPRVTRTPRDAFHR